MQLVKKLPAFHGTRRFITSLTSVRHISLSWASPIQSTYPHRYTEVKSAKLEDPCPGERKMGRKWLGRPKLCTKSCRAVLRRRRRRRNVVLLYIEKHANRLRDAPSPCTHVLQPYKILFAKYILILSPQLRPRVPTVLFH